MWGRIEWESATRDPASDQENTMAKQIQIIKSGVIKSVEADTLPKWMADGWTYHVTGRRIVRK